MFDVNDFLKVDDEMQVKVISVKDGKIGLSIKQASPEYSVSVAAGRRRYLLTVARAGNEAVHPLRKISKFLKDSRPPLRPKQEHRRASGGRGSRYYR